MSQKLALVLVVVAGCGKDGAKSSSATKTSGCEINPAKSADLVVTKTPGLLAPLDKLSLGMSRDDAAKACPNFFAAKDASKKTGTFSTGEIVGKIGETYLQPRLEFVGDKLDSVEYSLPADIAAALTATWGAPKQSTGDKPALAWFDDAKHTRALLEPPDYDGRRALVVSSYMPLEAFLEPDTNRIAWKPHDVLGKQPAELVKAFPQLVSAHPTSESAKKMTDDMMKDLNKDLEKAGIDTKRNDNLPELELPASPFGDGARTNIMLYADDDGTLRSYGLWFHTHNISPDYSFPEQSANIVKVLDAAWGPHKTVDATLGKRMQWYDAKRFIRAGSEVDKPEDMDVVFTRYLPIANLFGNAGPQWGFENAERPLIGATPDEIAAAYGKVGTVKRDDANETITLSLPPSDYESDTGRTSILMFVRKGKVAEWRFTLPYDNYPAARGEYEAALAAKYNVAKLPAPSKYGEINVAKGIVAQFSDITHSLEVQVGAK